jgi:hypothetical protein
MTCSCYGDLNLRNFRAFISLLQNCFIHREIKVLKSSRELKVIKSSNRVNSEQKSKVSETFSASFNWELHQVTEILKVRWELTRILISENCIILFCCGSQWMPAHTSLHRCLVENLPVTNDSWKTPRIYQCFELEVRVNEAMKRRVPLTEG